MWSPKRGVSDFFPSECGEASQGDLMLILLLATEERLVDQIAKMDTRIAIAKTQMGDRDKTKDVALGTSKINYIVRCTFNITRSVGVADQVGSSIDCRMGKEV